MDYIKIFTLTPYLLVTSPHLELDNRQLSQILLKLVCVLKYQPVHTKFVGGFYVTLLIINEDYLSCGYRQARNSHLKYGGIRFFYTDLIRQQLVLKWAIMTCTLQNFSKHLTNVRQQHYLQTTLLKFTYNLVDVLGFLQISFKSPDQQSFACINFTYAKFLAQAGPYLTLRNLIH